jgi:hypothetical protein
VVLSLAAQPGSSPGGDPSGEIRPLYYACCYHVEAKRFDYFDPRNRKDVARLLARLADATEVVTFNGEALGLRMLREHHGLGAIARHTDLAAVPGVHAPRIDPGAYAYDPENRRHARQACQDEARQVLQLWKLHRAGVLR